MHFVPLAALAERQCGGSGQGTDILPHFVRLFVSIK